MQISDVIQKVITKTILKNVFFFSSFADFKIRNSAMGLPKMQNSAVKLPKMQNSTEELPILDMRS